MGISLLPPDMRDALDAEAVRAAIPNDGEMVVFAPEPTDVEEMEDGSALILLDDGMGGMPADFGANVAEFLDESQRRMIAADLLELIERDREARKKRDEQYEEGLRRSGLGDDAPGGADFEGASRVVHPVIAEACVDFAARSIRELFPANGPVRSKIVGDQTKAKNAKASRKTKYMNWQLTEQCEEYRGELEQMLTQLPLGGSQYMKGWWDSDRQRPCFEFVPVDDILLPYAATSFVGASRKTHQQYLSEHEYERRVMSGLYRDVDVTPSLDPEQTASGKASDKIEGRERSGYNEDGLRRVYEVYTWLEIDGTDDGTAPYIVTVDEVTTDLLAVYRNWKEGDPKKKPLDWIVEFPFIPWRGAYAIGLPHLIGGMSAALTGALRALLDTAHINNTVTMVKLKGSRIMGQTTTVAPTQIAEIEGPAGNTDPDIRKLAMAMPFNPPSTVLFSLLEWLTGQAKGVVSTAEEKIADASNSMPVGTAQALIEQGSMVFSAIHARLHAAQARLLAILHRLNAEYLDDEVVIAELGELVVRRSDFEGPVDVIPVSDPAIFSETQRYAQAQSLIALHQQFPGVMDPRVVLRRVLEVQKVPQIEELMPGPPEMAPVDPATENAAILRGMPAKAYPEQDHMAHIEVHAQALLDPNLGSNPVFSPIFIPAMAQHLAEHVALHYQRTMEMAAGAPLGEAADDQQAAQIAQRLAQVSPQVRQLLGQQFQNLPMLLQAGMQAFQQGAQAMTQMAPPPQKPPEIEAMEQETQRRAARDQQEMQLRAQKEQADAEEARAKLLADAQREAADIAARERMNAQDNETALTIAGMRAQRPMMPRPGLDPNPTAPKDFPR